LLKAIAIFKIIEPFEDGGDEFAARMTMNGDKVAGILSA
jgi:hypothetical protein